MRIARINVYIPDELAERAKTARLNVSALTQDALRRALAGEATNRWLNRLERAARAEVAHDVVLNALDEAREESGTRG